MPFAQLVIGPPGSGKSTYCDGMHQFMAAIDRKCSVVNLDPANDHTNYPAALDVRDLVTLEEIMEAEELGPNGGVLYALEELEHNVDWLEQGLKNLGDDYVLFDCPGQVELFTHHSSLRNIFLRLEKLGYRLVVVGLTDSYVLTLPTLYISALLLSLRSMLQMDITQINVLTKIDNLASYPSLPLPLSFYTEARSLEHILSFLEAEQRNEPIEPILDSGPESTRPGTESESETPAEEDRPPSKFSALNEAIIDLVEDFSLVGFETLAVEDRQSMTQLLRAIDRAGGYAFGASEGANDSIWQVAVREGGSAGFMEVRDIEERWIDRRAEFDELERKQWEEEAKAARGSEAPAATTNNHNAGLGSHIDPDGQLGKRDGGIKVVRKPPS